MRFRCRGGRSTGRIVLPLAGIGLLFNVLVATAGLSPDVHAGFECGVDSGGYAGGTCS